MILFKNHKSLWIYSVIFLFIFTDINNAHSDTNLQLKTSVISQGGNLSQSTNYQVRDVIGQPSPVNNAASANFQIFSGYINQIQESGELPHLPEYWNYTNNTDNNANVVLPTDANPNIEGVVLMNGDYIGVFTPEGLCCGYRQWQGANLSITVWGDDSQTPGVVDGFRTGETINYRVYRLSEQREWTTVLTGYSTGDGIYSANGFMVLDRFDVLGVSLMTLNFSQGWNMFSVNVDPVNPNIELVMTPIIDKLVIVKNSEGNTFIPAYSINDIGDIHYTEGYQAYMNQAATLAVTGQATNPATPISLPVGWSMIGYLPQAPVDIATALASISTQLVIAKNNEGNTYIPLYGINDIGDMQPGQGYQIYLNAAGTLVYPSAQAQATSKEMAGLEKTSKATTSVEPQHFQFTASTGVNSTVVIPADINPQYSDGTPLTSGDEIGVFNSADLCCGAIVWEEQNTAISVWGDDVQSDTLDGFLMNDTLQFKVWRQSTDTEYSTTVAFQENQPTTFQSNGFSILSELIANLQTSVSENEAAAIPAAFKLRQNYPNPFNPETTIEFELPHASRIVLGIYDIRGREIRRLAQGTYPAGYHSMIWDGRDYSGTIVASGLYFYQIEVKSGIKDYMDIKKMILMK